MMEMITVERSIEILSAGLEFFAATISLMLLMGCIICDRRGTRIARAVERILIAHIVMLVSDAFVWFFVSIPKYILLTQICTVISYGMGCLIFVFFTECLIGYINVNADVPQWMNSAIKVYCGVITVAWVLGMASGTYFYFDAEGFFCYGPLYWLSQAFGAVLLLGHIVLIIYYRKAIGRRDTTLLLIYVLLPLVGMILQLWWEVVPLYLGVTWSIVLYYCAIYVYRGKMLLYQNSVLTKKEIELSEGRSRILINQIQPHFVINSLVTIRHLCKKDTAEAVETIDHFTDFLRESMENFTLRRCVPFSRELDTVKNYLYLEQKRFGDKLTVHYDIREYDFQLPALSIQPIVENAVRHGIRKRIAGGTLTISTYTVDDWVMIEVNDDGVGFDMAQDLADGKTHVGMDNVRNRLALMCQGQFSVKSKPGMGTTVTMGVPCNMEDWKG